MVPRRFKAGRQSFLSWYSELFTKEYSEEHLTAQVIVIAVILIAVYSLVILINDFSTDKLKLFILKIIFAFLLSIIIKAISEAMRRELK